VNSNLCHALRLPRAAQPVCLQHTNATHKVAVSQKSASGRQQGLDKQDDHWVTTCLHDRGHRGARDVRPPDDRLAARAQHEHAAERQAVVHVHALQLLAHHQVVRGHLRAPPTSAGLLVSCPSPCACAEPAGDPCVTRNECGRTTRNAGAPTAQAARERGRAVPYSSPWQSQDSSLTSVEARWAAARLVLRRP